MRTGSEPHIPILQPDSIGTWLASAMSSSLSPTFAITVGPGENTTETSPAWTASATRNSWSPG
jgi:hypothetical protein